jgi:uncharacterized Zn-finger protein
MCLLQIVVSTSISNRSTSECVIRVLFVTNRSPNVAPSKHTCHRFTTKLVINAIIVIRVILHVADSMLTSNNNTDNQQQMFQQSQRQRRTIAYSVVIATYHYPHTFNTIFSFIPITLVAGFERLARFRASICVLHTPQYHCRQQSYVNKQPLCIDIYGTYFSMRKHLFSEQNECKSNLVFKNQTMPKTSKSSRVKHQCGVCLKEFSRGDNLKQHMDGVHLGVKFACSECDYQATTKGNLSKHIDASHRGFRKFKCDQCDSSFFRSGTLATHNQSVHNKIRFVCTVKGCDKSYSRQGELNNHIKSFHEGQEHRCDQCGKVSTTKANLKKHILTVHSDERQFVCSFDNCGKLFTQSSNLNTHIKSIHERVRYPCSVCDKSFTSRGPLKTHMSSIHDKTRYQCSHCKKSYTERGRLNAHIKQQHQQATTNVSTKPTPTSFNCLFCGHCNVSLPAYYQHNIQFHANNIGGVGVI